MIRCRSESSPKVVDISSTRNGRICVDGERIRDERRWRVGVWKVDRRESPSIGMLFVGVFSDVRSVWFS